MDLIDYFQNIKYLDDNLLCFFVRFHSFFPIGMYSNKNASSEQQMRIGVR
jgi:hypothetical protein